MKFFLPSIIVASLIISGCGESSKSDTSKEYELNVTQDGNKTITFNFELLKDNIFASLQLSPSINPPIEGDINVSSNGAGGTQKYSDYFSKIEGKKEHRM